jgi:hypothetical protein
MKAILSDKKGLVFDDREVASIQEAIDFAKSIGNCHMSVEVNPSEDFYAHFDIVKHEAYRVFYF